MSFVFYWMQALAGGGLLFIGSAVFVTEVGSAICSWARLDDEEGLDPLSR